MEGIRRGKAGKRKKIELCAARPFEARGTRDMEMSRKVNLGTGAGNGVRPPDFFYGEFDSGSERTLAACLRHASRTGQVE